MLNATIRHHLSKYRSIFNDFVDKFLQDLYVDDTVSGCRSIGEGKVFYDRASSIMGEAGFTFEKVDLE